jgi:hypothetical protein
MKKVIVAVVSAVTVLMLGAMPASASSDSADVRSFATGQVVPGSSSTLMRSSRGVQMTLHTSGLTSGDAVTVWFVIFNDPAACTHGDAGLRCGAGDLLPFGGDPAVGSSIVSAAGHVIGGSGNAGFAGAMAVGDTSRALFGPGLTDPVSADIHLLVVDHGPMAGAAQIRSFGACNPRCENVQFSAHESG